MAAAILTAPRRLSLPQGFAISGTLHGLVALSLLLATQLLVTPPRTEPPPLALDLQGLMPEAAEAIAQPPAEEAPPPPPPQAQPVSQPAPKVRVPKVTKAPPAPPAPAAIAETPAPPSPAPAPAQSPQTALTLSEAEIAYTKEVKRRLRAAMDASDEVRKAGLDGIVTVGFVIDQDGRLVADSLRLVRSSGIPVLDRNALSIPLTTPFDRPPRTMSFSVDIVFRG